MVDFLFPIPLWKFSLDVAEENYTKAISYCKQFYNKDPGVQYTNVGGWQSPHMTGSEVRFTPLKLFFNQIDDKANDILHSFNSKSNFEISNFWINVNFLGNKNSKHWHPSSDLSGVFYLTDKNSKLVFFREKDHMMFLMEKLSSYSYKNINLFSNYYEPKKGDVYIFPSFLEHLVEENTDPQPRVSVAFNIKIT